MHRLHYSSCIVLPFLAVAFFCVFLIGSFLPANGQQKPMTLQDRQQRIEAGKKAFTDDDWLTAVRFWEEARQSSLPVEDVPGEIYYLHRLGKAYLYLGKLDMAVKRQGNRILSHFGTDRSVE